MKTVRWGLLGAGSVTRQFAHSVALLKDHRVQAVASRSLERARGLANDLGASTAHGSYAALVADPSVDAIYVATPAALHREHVTLALRAKKPVLCEKPFAVSAAEARTMAEVAREERVFCMEAMWMRFIPVLRTLRERIRAGDIGTVRLIQAELGFSMPFDASSRYYDPALGGGALLDLGVYPLSLAWFLLGPPEEGRALASRAATGVDDQTAMVLSYGSGALASLTCTFAQRARNSAFVLGTNGSFSIDAPLYAPSRIVHTRGAPSSASGGGDSGPGRVGRLVESIPALVGLRRRYAPTLRQLVRRERTAIEESFQGFGYQFEAEEVGRCLDAGLLESPDMPLQETVDILSAADAFRSTGSFRWKDLQKGETSPAKAS